MSNQPTTETRRIFRYGDKTFPDPGVEHTPQQVLEHLKTFFIELANGRIDEKTLDDGTLEISFSKQVTTKGGDASMPPPDEPGLLPVREKSTALCP